MVSFIVVVNVIVGTMLYSTTIVVINGDVVSMCNGYQCNPVHSQLGHHEQRHVLLEQACHLSYSCLVVSYALKLVVCSQSNAQLASHTPLCWLAFWFQSSLFWCVSCCLQFVPFCSSTRWKMTNPT